MKACAKAWQALSPAPPSPAGLHTPATALSSYSGTHSLSLMHAQLTAPSDEDLRQGVAGALSSTPLSSGGAGGGALLSKAAAVGVWEGQVASWSLTLTNTSGSLPVTSCHVAVANAKVCVRARVCVHARSCVVVLGTAHCAGPRAIIWHAQFRLRFICGMPSSVRC